MLESNQEAISLYGLVAGQVIVAGMGEAIGLNFVAVKVVLDLYEVSDQRDCFERILHIYRRIQDETKPAPKGKKDELKDTAALAKQYGVTPPRKKK